MVEANLLPSRVLSSRGALGVPGRTGEIVDQRHRQQGLHPLARHAHCKLRGFERYPNGPDRAQIESGARGVPIPLAWCFAFATASGPDQHSSQPLITTHNLSPVQDELGPSFAYHNLAGRWAIIGVNRACPEANPVVGWAAGGFPTSHLPDQAFGMLRP